jgi:serine/threonine-protein kinase
MEHIHGEDLRSIVRAMKSKGVTEFPLEHAIAITLGVAAGLAYAHERTDLNGNPLHIVHRDISPQNILVTFTGDVKIVDFGIAKASQTKEESPEALLAPGADAGKDREHHTKVGQLKGKVPYMSPEQARGEPLDGRSDVFALGVILFELCTGRRLFRGPNEYETLKMITEGEYPRPSAVNPRISPALEAVIMKALAKDVARRYQTAREMQADLESVVRAEQIPVSTLALGKWMEMLFEEKLAAQRQALLEGKQLADVLAAEQPDDYTQAGTMGGSLGVVPPPSKVPWIVAVSGILLVAGVGVGLYAYKEKQREAAAAEQRAINSGAIEIHSVPEGASIWLNNSPTPHRTPYTLRNLATGRGVRFAVKLTAEGYAPFTQEVALATRNARATVTAQLERARADSYAVLEVSTTPRGAAVLVDGRQVPGVTPLTVPELAPGVEHTVLVRHPDTLDETFTFVGQAGQIERRPLVLRERPLAADEAWVDVTTEPSAVLLRVGEREITTGSPFHVRVRAGQILQFAFSAPGYEGETRQVRARPGQTLTLPTVRLERPRATGVTPVVDRRPGSLRVGSSPWCNVTVDGRAHGQTPVDISSISPGTHTVVCTNPVRGSQTQRVTVQPGQQAIARFRFP